ncbi:MULTISPECIES: hypothetical protein [unclassified Nostoc]|uniref:hypothetical protein n=1 Tax=unclassified Nostoc TaxID=2593658 RepID=UPI0025F103E5|nr:MULTISPECIES: hypothetical protein [unclassified Nostoc]MBN3991589.1 hypothetical protein [Nostoc sp. NMS2]
MEKRQRGGGQGENSSPPSGASTNGKKHRAIGNRGYTNEVRLSFGTLRERGLSETREGGFGLYSPRLLV